MYCTVMYYTAGGRSFHTCSAHTVLPHGSLTAAEGSLVHCTLYCALCIAHWALQLCTVPHALYTILLTVHCTLHTAHCTLYCTV